MSAATLLPCPPMLKEFSFEREGVQSRFVLVHQLRASADIQDNEMTERMGRKATTDRASLMREAADAIERLATHSPQPDALPGDLREKVAQIIEAAIERHNPGNSLRHTLGDADAILSLIQSERGDG